MKETLCCIRSEVVYELNTAWMISQVTKKFCSLSSVEFSKNSRINFIESFDCLRSLSSRLELRTDIFGILTGSRPDSIVDLPGLRVRILEVSNRGGIGDILRLVEGPLKVVRARAAFGGLGRPLGSEGEFGDDERGVALYQPAAN
ncbi:hypothetical protein [Natrialba sp. INN-245]|uniref:hypothetical protein n=1 Tax=Natrialba sp. INN-245 TaxID=2690967 RepID=UPI001357682C|nr:hypothetical protein [Natrialba sp. INN-245]